MSEKEKVTASDTGNDAPHFEVKILRETGLPPIVTCCKMPRPTPDRQTGTGIAVDLVIREIDGETTVKGTVTDISDK